MSTNINIRDGVSVSRYCGPGDTPGPHRIRFQIDTRGGQVYGLTIADAFAIARALVHLACDSMMQYAPFQQDA